MIEFRVWDWVLLDGRQSQIIQIGPSSVIVEDGATSSARTVTRATLESAEPIEAPLPRSRNLASVAEFERLSSMERARCTTIAAAIDQVL